MDQQSSIVILILGFLVVGVIFAPPAIEAFVDGLRDVFNDIRDTWFSDWGDGNGDGNGINGGDNETATWDTDLDGDMGLAVTLYFTDGTSQNIEPRPLTIFPLMIYFDGKELSKIVYEGSAKITWTGDLQTLHFEGFLGSSVWISGRYTETHGSIKQENFAKDISPLPEQDVWFTVVTQEITANEIQSEMSEEGTWIVSNTFSTTVTATFEDGELSGKHGTTNAELTVDYERSALKTLSITISGTPS